MSGSQTGLGICECTDGSALADFVAQTLSGIGEIACQVFNKALELGVDIVTTVVAPEDLAVTAAEQAAYKAVFKAVGKAGDSGVINFCAGVNFTSAPSTIFNNIPRATVMPELDY